MKLFIFSGKEQNVIPGQAGKNDVVLGHEISEATDFFYDSVEAYDFLEVHPEENCLQILLSKVTAGGKLLLQGTEIYRATEMLDKGKLGTNDFSMIVTGGRVRCNSVHGIVNELQQSGFEVKFAGITNHYYTIEARRK